MTISAEVHQNTTAATTSPDLPGSNGKAQPWKQEWPPRTTDLVGVAEQRGQMLLLDGTGGSGTIAVPNNVILPPKSLENANS